MKRSNLSSERIVYDIRPTESRAPIGDLFRQLGGSGTALYTWRKMYVRE